MHKAYAVNDKFKKHMQFISLNNNAYNILGMQTFQSRRVLLMNVFVVSWVLNPYHMVITIHDYKKTN